MKLSAESARAGSTKPGAQHRSTTRASVVVRSDAAATSGRRALLAAGVLLAASSLAGGDAAQARDRPVINKDVAVEDSPYMQELLRRTEEKREERKKERLDAYNRKIFKDYFEFDGGTESAARARGLSAETAAAYRKWLDENK